MGGDMSRSTKGTLLRRGRTCARGVLPTRGRPPFLRPGTSPLAARDVAGSRPGRSEFFRVFVKGRPVAAQDDHVIVSFTFDDARDTQYSALSVFGDQDMRATFYANTGTVGSPGFRRQTQLHGARRRRARDRRPHREPRSADRHRRGHGPGGDPRRHHHPASPRIPPPGLLRLSLRLPRAGPAAVRQGKRGTPPPEPPTSTHGSQAHRRTRMRCGYPAGASTAPRAWPPCRMTSPMPRRLPAAPTSSTCCTTSDPRSTPRSATSSPG